MFYITVCELGKINLVF